MSPSHVCSLFAGQASTAAARAALGSARSSFRRAKPAAFSALRATAACGYATQHQSTSSSKSSSSTSRRRAVTPFNDDGRVPWTELSGGEKTARAAQQTFNFGMVVVGVVLTGGVAYFMYTEVFSPSSKVAAFNRAVDRITADRRCVEVLGDSRKITAFGEETSNKWRRARPIASTEQTDAQGNEHLVMNFHVQGPRAQGTANLHLVRRAGQSEFAYRYFYLDVPGHDRIYLENTPADSKGDKARTLFGIKWS